MPKHRASLELEGELSAIRVEAVHEGSAFWEAGVRAGDVLMEVAGEPFFAGSALDELRGWLVRELDIRPREVELRVRRDGAELTLHATLSLEAF